MDDIDTFPATRMPTARRPLLGLTILVVEDSRYACDALRLMCLRSGARIRRADCLASARRHLQVYRPSAVIIDLGLPDGSGTDLIAELDAVQPRIGVILATSGDDTAQDRATAAGADGFLSKPLVSLAAFQHAVLSNLPADRQPQGPRAVADEVIRPDPIAYRDDMVHAAEVLDERDDARTLDYLAQFLAGVAHAADDRALAATADALVQQRADGTATSATVAKLAGLIQDRANRPIAI